LDSAGFLLGLYDNIDVFLLITVRLLAFFLLLPIISGQYVPMMAKIGLAMYISLISVSTGTLSAAAYDNSVLGYLMLILGEFAVGLILAFAAYLVFSVFLFAGQLIDFQIGFSMVSVFDPVTQIQVPITGNLYYMVAAILFLQLGGLNSFIYTIFHSYKVLPIGGAFIIGNGGTLSAYILKMLGEMMVMGLQIALPVVGTVLAVDIALGLLVKAVPQMNIFVVGMPIKLFIGLMVLLVIAPLFIEYYNYVYEAAANNVMTLIRGMTK